MAAVFDDAKISDYTYDEIYQFYRSMPGLQKYPRLVPLLTKHIVKGYRAEEIKSAVQAIEFAAQLGVRVPRVHRTVWDHHGDACCIMERVPGSTLDEKWQELGWFTSIRLAFQLGRMVSLMQSAESATCGAVSSGSTYESFYLDDSWGIPAHGSRSQVNAFLNFWSNMTSPSREVQKTPAEHAVCPREFFSCNSPFVFTHHDLAPRNVMLDDEGHLWLVDWDTAGYYPKFFEYSAMHRFIPIGWSRFALWRWQLFAWIAAGTYDYERRLLGRIEYRTQRFRPMRRWNIHAGGYAAFGLEHRLRQLDF